MDFYLKLKNINWFFVSLICFLSFTGMVMIYSATKPSDNSETLLTGYKLMNNPTDSRYFIGCNCSYINLDNGGNSTLWHTYFKQANYTDRMKLYNERQGCSL